MGLFKKMGAKLGIGAATVTLEIEKDGYAWGEVVRGVARVQAGNAEQHASEIQAAVLEHWETRDSDGDREDNYRRYNEVTLANDVTLTPGAEQSFPFQVEVPAGVSLGTNWFAEARVKIQGGADRSGATGFKLLPPEGIRGLMRAFEQAADFNLNARSNNQTEVTLDYRPSRELQKQFDGVKFIVTEADGRVAGVMEVNPQEKSMGDRFKALLKKDRVRHEIAFSADSLTAVSGPSTDVINELRRLLSPYMQ
jgi:sporulation-control protein spo0M